MLVPRLTDWSSPAFKIGAKDVFNPYFVGSWCNELAKAREGKDVLSRFQNGCLLYGSLQLPQLSGSFILDDILGQGLAANGGWRH